MQSTQPNTMVPFAITSFGIGKLSHPNDPDLYRIRIQPTDATPDGPTIKYLTAPNTSHTITGANAHARRRNLLAFDKVPAGDWVVGRLLPTDKATDGQDRKLELASTETDTAAALEGLGLRSAKPVFCGTTVDLQDCQDLVDPETWTKVSLADGREVYLPKPEDLQCMDYVDAEVVRTPPGVTVPVGAAGEVVVRVTDWHPGHWVSIETDARAHEIIQERDPGLTPRLVAHVTENRLRVFGFLLERIPGAREAGAANLGACRSALERLHALGLAMWQLSRHSFLVRGDGSVMVRGPFDSRCFMEDEDVVEEIMEAEMDSLEEVLAQSPSKFEDQAAAIRRLVDPQRMKALEDFQQAHGFIVPFVHWQESQKGGGRITLTVEQHGELAEQYRANGFRWTDELQEQAEKRFGPSAEAAPGIAKI